MVTFQKRVGLSEATLARFLSKARRAVGLKGTVHVMVTSSREMQKLNRHFRGKNQATDVLSFSAPLEMKCRIAGDVAISADIAVANARRLGHSAGEEIKILLLHGVLHLAGYNHDADDGKMARRETKLRKSFGLPVGLIERTGQSLRRGRAVAKVAKSKPATRRKSLKSGRSKQAFAMNSR